ANNHKKILSKNNPYSNTPIICSHQAALYFQPEKNNIKTSPKQYTHDSENLNKTITKYKN
ncbi:MAG: hypothetical protein ACOCZM_02530, partial [Bacillota bacterium]